MKRIFQQMKLSDFPQRRNNSHFLQIVTLIMVMCLFPQVVKSQWLQDLRTNHYNSLTVQFWKAQETNETAISYIDGNQVVTQTQITFSADRRQINQSITKDGIKVESNLFSFNQRKQMLGKTLRTSTDGSQWTFQKLIYAYHGNNLTSINSVKLTGELIYILIVKNDSLGMPIKVEQRSPDSTLIASETCQLDKSKNKITFRLVDANGGLISTTEGKIAPKRTGKEKYNLHGDCYLYSRNESPSDNIFCKVEFEYDSNGNWIKKKVYQGELDDQGNLIDAKLAVDIKRKIKYIRQD